MDKLFVKYSFYEANQDFQTICVDYGRRQGCEMINIENGLGLAVPDIPLYDPTCFQPIQEAFSSLFYGDYLSELDFPFSSVKQLHGLFSDHGGHGASTSGRADNEK